MAYWPVTILQHWEHSLQQLLKNLLKKFSKIVIDFSFQMDV